MAETTLLAGLDPVQFNFGLLYRAGDEQSHFLSDSAPRSVKYLLSEAWDDPKLIEIFSQRKEIHVIGVVEIARSGTARRPDRRRDREGSADRPILDPGCRQMQDLGHLG